MAVNRAFKVRIVFTDAKDYVRHRIDGWTGIQLNPENVITGVFDLQKQPITPLSRRMIKEDDKMLLQIYPEAALDMDVSDVTLSIPVTVKSLATGDVTPDTFGKADFGMTEDSGADAYAANTWKTIGTYTCSAQEQVALGHKQAETSCPILQFDDLD